MQTYAYFVNRKLIVTVLFTTLSFMLCIIKRKKFQELCSAIHMKLRTESKSAAIRQF